MLTSSSPAYLTGFGGHVATEAVPGALPKGRNSPQRPAFGLYTEQLSGTAFTMPRHENRRSWLYRMRPTADHRPFVPMRARRGSSAARAGPAGAQPAALGSAADLPAGTDFVDGLVHHVFNRAPPELEGVAVHLYRANAERSDRVFVDRRRRAADHAAAGRLELLTELGRIEIAPGSDRADPARRALPVELPDGEARGYVAENYGAPFRLPDLGPIGANGLANPRDFETPVAWFEDRDEPTEVIQKYGGQLWTTTLDHSARSTSSPGTAIRAVPLRPVALQRDRHGQLRPSRSVDLHRADQPEHVPGAPMPTSSSSRRAGWWPRTRSARPGSTAT
jgi:homogentisate 1,2-dioxygenase